jgi:hypothetical protein
MPRSSSGLFPSRFKPEFAVDMTTPTLNVVEGCTLQIKRESTYREPHKVSQVWKGQALLTGSYETFLERRVVKKS